MTTTINRHPDDANLMSFAAGVLAEPLAAVVASHLALCPQCRAEMRTLRTLGGVLLADDAVAGSRDLPYLTPAAASAPIADSAALAAKIRPNGLPAPLAIKYGITLETLAWRWLGPGVWHHRLPLSPGVGGDLRLLKIAAGRKMPEHGHGGTELTLVLDGAYSDASGTFRAGDVQDVDDHLQHQPLVDPSLGCVCLVASEQPARFKGFFSRVLQPWTGM